MKSHFQLLTLCCVGAGISFIGTEAGAQERSAAKAISAPLLLNPDNPRYFTDGTKGADGRMRAVYLTGSHNWYNLQDAGEVGRPLTRRFAFDEYLDLLSGSNHNFIRLWAWESAGYWHQGKGVGKEYYEPLPYRRHGAGTRFRWEAEIQPAAV